MKDNNPLRLVWANHEFHMHFVRSCGNGYLIRALENVRCEANRLAYLSFGKKTELAGDLLHHYQSVCQEHRQIMDFLFVLPAIVTRFVPKSGPGCHF